MEEKTKYEKDVEQGLTPQMSGLDGIFITLAVEDILIQTNPLEEDITLLKDCWDEIEYIYKDDDEKIQNLKSILFKK